ncbi:caf1 family ribonuclease [Colletotrichum incanum]|uniref:Caf1 family ribonuclease n=1 Tax=Colletotrichum incanum TaxID=1573173 RepID=A0A167APC4_COLIC|nr:caf1 family ribonuclease [Colletotrichum incanum]OHW93391.1 caf1 family ribonuclease [Colletotrichum incanum]
MTEYQLKKSQPVIVGYNQFMDLLFLNNTFVDDLPELLNDFLAKIHGLFPYFVNMKLLGIKDQAMEGEDPMKNLCKRHSECNVTPQLNWHTMDSYGQVRPMIVGHIERDPDHVEDPRTSSSSWSEASDADDTGVNQSEWGDPAFDLIRNTTRIVPQKTVCLGE